MEKENNELFKIICIKIYFCFSDLPFFKKCNNKAIYNNVTAIAVL